MYEEWSVGTIQRSTGWEAFVLGVVLCQKVSAEAFVGQGKVRAGLGPLTPAGEGLFSSLDGLELLFPLGGGGKVAFICFRKKKSRAVFWLRTAQGKWLPPGIVRSRKER